MQRYKTVIRNILMMEIILNMNSDAILEASVIPQPMDVLPCQICQKFVVVTQIHVFMKVLR